MPWNPCPPSRGIAAHLPVESVPTMAWNTQPTSETAATWLGRRPDRCGFLEKIVGACYLTIKWTGVSRSALGSWGDSGAFLLWGPRVHGKIFRPP